MFAKVPSILSMEFGGQGETLRIVADMCYDVLKS